MKLNLENIGLGKSDEDELFTDDEMVKKKEKRIEEAMLRKTVEEVINDCIGKTGHADSLCIADKLAEQERLSLSENRLKRIEENVEELSEDSLKISRRIVKLANDLKQVEKDVVGIKEDITLMKDRARTIKELSEDYEIKRDSKWEQKRDTMLRVAVIIVSVIAVLVSIWNYLR